MKKLPFHPCQKGDKILICYNAHPSIKWDEAFIGGFAHTVAKVNPDRSLRVKDRTVSGNVRSWVVTKRVHP
jgi:hypothetical protein